MSHKSKFGFTPITSMLSELNSIPKPDTTKSRNHKWTFIACFNEAKKHKTKTAWSTASYSSYCAALRHKAEGWFELCTKHMPKYNKPTTLKKQKKQKKQLSRQK